MKKEDLINPEFFANNRKKLREAFSGTAPIIIGGNSLLQKSADTAYEFTQDSNFWYLTGIREPGLTLVLDGDKEYIILPNEDPVRSAFEGSLDIEILESISGISTFIDQNEGWKKLGRKISKVKHIATLQPPASYIEQMLMFTSPARITLVEKIKSHNPDVDLIDLRTVFSGLRSVKQPLEIELMEKAIDYTKKIYKIAEKIRTKSINENEIMAETSKYIIKNNLDWAYRPIIASGANAVTLHYVKNNSEIDHKKVLLVDMAAKFSGYCADITRSVVSGPTKRQKNVYDAVLAVQEYAISLLKPGLLLADYEGKVQQFMGEKLRELGLISSIDKENVQKYFPHSVSHFLGIDPHDLGDYKAPLVEGMVLTVEPGIYISEEKIGIRIEDMVLITKTGNKVMSESIPKNIETLA